MRWLLPFFTGLLVVWLALSPAATAAPQLQITSPTVGESVSGSAVRVSFQVSGVRLRPPPVKVSEAGEHPEQNSPEAGHLHMMLDLSPVVMWASQEPYTFEDVPPGEHQLMVEVVNNDHSPFSPPVVREVRFTVVAPPEVQGAREEAGLPQPAAIPSTGEPTGSVSGMALVLVLLAVGAAGLYLRSLGRRPG